MNKANIPKFNYNLKENITMKYNKSKKLVAIITFIFLTGIIVPVVFADENISGNVGNIQKNQEQQEETIDKNSDDEFDDENSNEKSEEESPELEWDIVGYPDSADKNKWFDEEAFYHETKHDLYYDKDIYYDSENDHRKKRQFLRVYFSVDEVKAELEFEGRGSLNNLIDSVTVCSDSSTISMLDADFINNKLHEIEAEYGDSEDDKTKKIQDFIDEYIFIKDDINKNEAVLYIPVIPLMSNMKYSVRLDSGVVKAKHEGEDIDNHPLEWSFKAMAVPSVSEGDVIVQSVAENYDVTEPIIIFGKYFDSYVEVFFNDVRAHRIRVYEDEQKKHSTKQEDNIYHNKEDEDSEDNDDIDQYIEIYLPRGRNKLRSGLYNIIIENSRNHSVELYGVLSVVPRARGRAPTEEYKYGTKTPYGSVRGSSRMELIRLDHKEPIKEETLRRQLSQYILRSPIVETSGSSYATYIYTLEIPYTNGIASRLKVLRYDEFLRRWVEESCYINNVDHRVIVTTFNRGAFVVVESKI